LAKKEKKEEREEESEGGKEGRGKNSVHPKYSH
jgi:hypothetical protein